MVSVLLQGLPYSSTLVNLNWEIMTTSSAAEHLCSCSPETDTNPQADLCVSHPARLSRELGSLAYHLHTFVNV